MASNTPVFVTGGSGFIGSAVIRRLLAEGEPCVVLDQVPPSEDDVEFREFDVCNLQQCKSALDGAKRVVHLAGLVAGDANKNPNQAVSVNIMGTTNVFEACAELGVELVVWASTFFVYEDCNLDFVDESTKLDVSVMGPFARSKFVCEQIARDYQKKHDLRTIGLRFGSVYGPGKGTNVIREFVEQAVRGEEIVVWGEGKRHRQFVHVDDVAGGVTRALEYDKSGIINIAGTEQTTTRQLLDIIRSQIPSVNVTFDATKPEKVQPYRMGLQNSETELGWSPWIDIAQGISGTVNWFTQLQESAASDS